MTATKTITDFANDLIEAIKTIIPDLQDAEFQVQQVKKPGNLTLTGIIIRVKNLPVAPCYYIDEEYTKHLNGAPIADIASRVATAMKSSAAPASDIDISLITDFDKAKSYIIPRLIDIRPGKNDGYLKDRVCNPIAGTQIGIIYDLDIPSTQAEMTVGVTNTLLDMWNLSADDLHELAIQNGSKIRPVYFSDMFSMLNDLSPLPFPEAEPDATMFVLTSKNKTHGASVILYPETVQMLHDRFPKGFWLLPSSTHDWIIVHKSVGDPDMLKEMVMTINASEVLPADQLADEVFTLDSAGNLIVAMDSTVIE